MRPNWFTAVVVAAVMSGALTAIPVGSDPAAGLVTQLDAVVVDNRGDPITGATVRSGGQAGLTDTFGRVRIVGVGSGDVEISHPVHGDRLVSWSGAGDRLRVVLSSPVRRAVHIVGSIPGTPRWQELLTLADQTSLNAVMIDIKDESGRVFPTSSSSWAALAGSVLSKWSLAEVVAEAHDHQLAVITRIVAFQDPVAGRSIPQMAAWDLSTGGPYTRRGLVYLDPTDPDARAYAMELAAEACSAGVDEVQFDYVRFPDGSGSGVRFDGGASVKVRVSTITGFLADARAAMPASCDVAADIFGFITSIDGDGGIGQDLSDLAGVIDVVSPMVYPNHWGPGWFGFSVPEDHPAAVVDASSRNGLARLVGSGTALRPWLQDFGGYGATEVRSQIEAADALGLGWMIWNAGSVFSEAGIPSESEVSAPSVAPPPVEEDLPGSGFWDVPDGSSFSADVRWLGSAGITRGCDPPWRDNFCPRRILSRAEAAALLVRGLDLPSSPIDRFGDDTGSTHEAAINSLAAAGITQGCGPRRFCPNEPLTRAQMAALIARAFELPAVEADTFDDDNGSSLEADIERIAAVGITRGCGPERFCPDDPVSREQVAAFLRRAITP